MLTFFRCCGEKVILVDFCNIMTNDSTQFDW